MFARLPYHERSTAPNKPAETRGGTRSQAASYRIFPATSPVSDDEATSTKASPRRDFFLRLPNELVFGIADYLDLAGLDALTKTNRHLNQTLSSHFHRKGVLNPWADQAINPVTRALSRRQCCNHGPTWTALHQMALSGNIYAMQRLLEQGAAVDAFTVGQDSFSGASLLVGTPLLVAIKASHPDAVLLLLQYGADVNALADLETAHCAKDRRTIGPIGLAWNTYLTSALAWPQRREDRLQLLELLVEFGADVNMPNEKGGTPLMVAASLGQEDAEATRTLLENGANVDAMDPTGRTALFYAYDYDVVKCLVDGGADVNVRAFDGPTVILNAARHSTPSVVQLLLDHGADPEEIRTVEKGPWKTRPGRWHRMVGKVKA